MNEVNNLILKMGGNPEFIKDSLKVELRPLAGIVVLFICWLVFFLRYHFYLFTQFDCSINIIDIIPMLKRDIADDRFAIII